MAQTATSQIGPDAIAKPPVEDIQVEPAPELHHLKDDKNQTSATQIGREAVAPPADATAEDENDLVFHDIPPFPEDVPIAPLLRLSLKKLVANDPSEIERLWQASCDVGFFYLDLRGAIEDSKRDSAYDIPSAVNKEGKANGEGLLKDAAGMFELGQKVFQLPLEEKNRYDYKHKGTYFGYKGYGQGIIDAKGTRDRMELWNVSKDDVLGFAEPEPVPEILQDDSNRTLLKSFMLRSHAILTLLFGHLNDKLGLPPDTLQNLHTLRGLSGDQARFIRVSNPSFCSVL